MYGLFLDDEAEESLTRNDKGVLVPYKKSGYCGQRYGGKIIASIVYCTSCGKAQGIMHSTESPYFLKVANGDSPEFVITPEGKFRHQFCKVKKETKNGKGNSSKR